MALEHTHTHTHTHAHIFVCKFRWSTAVGQAVACAPFTQRARVRSPIGTDFLGEDFSGFFLTCKTNARNLKAHKVPEYHLASIIIISYSPCWNDLVCALCLGYRLLCFCCIGGGPGIELNPHPGRPSSGLVWSKMYLIQRLIPSLDRLWLCKARVAWVT